jgi:hypothetical protein
MYVGHVNKVAVVSLWNNQQMRRGSSIIYLCIPNFTPNTPLIKEWLAETCWGKIWNVSINPATTSTHLLVISQRYYKILGPTIKEKTVAVRRKNQQYALIVPLLYYYVLAPTCFGTSLPSSGSLLDPPELLENTNWGLVYHITCGYVACVPDPPS